MAELETSIDNSRPANLPAEDEASERNNDETIGEPKTGTPIKILQMDEDGPTGKEHNTSIKDYFPGGLKDEDSASMDQKLDRLSLADVKEQRLLDDKFLDLHRNFSRAKFIEYAKVVLAICSERDNEEILP